MGTNERGHITVRLPLHLIERLDAECDRRVVGRNLIVTKAVERFLDTLPPMADPVDNGGTAP